jgi:hypothetical protein
MIAALLMSATLTDPYQVFGMARARWEAQHYPEKIAYTVAVDVVESGVRMSAPARQARSRRPLRASDGGGGTAAAG